MDKGSKIPRTYRSFMMKGKTLAGLATLSVLGALAVAQTNSPTIGQLAYQMKNNPTAWTVVVGSKGQTIDVVGASNVIAAIETFTSKASNVTISPSLSSVQVLLKGVSTVIPNSYPFYLQGAPLYLNNKL
ncbi:MAG: hypothetical protein ACPLX8_00735, partial [Nanopusillaceae archaeon]